jgi:sugar O-acyltransferase (sialic acid O-acetyltransferase NeuD family)
MKRELKKIGIYGAGGFGREVAMLIEQINMARTEWELIGFFDDNVPKGKSVNGFKVLGDTKDLNAWCADLYITIAIGFPDIKKAIVGKIENPLIQYPALIHPSAILGDEKYLSIGEGCIICSGNIITTNVSISRHVTPNLSCTVGHDVIISEYSSFMPSCSISGEVTIGSENFWGTGSKILNRCTTGDNVIIGAGAMVTKNLPDNVTAVGIPAKIIKEDTARVSGGEYSAVG